MLCCSYVGEVDIDGEMMPIIVTNFGKLPSPFGWHERVQVHVGEIPTNEQHEATIADKQRVMVAILDWKKCT